MYFLCGGIGGVLIIGRHCNNELLRYEQASSIWSYLHIHLSRSKKCSGAIIDDAITIIVHPIAYFLHSVEERVVVITVLITVAISSLSWIMLSLLLLLGAWSVRSKPKMHSKTIVHFHSIRNHRGLTTRSIYQT